MWDFCLLLPSQWIMQSSLEASISNRQGDTLISCSPAPVELFICSISSLVYRSLPLRYSWGCTKSHFFSSCGSDRGSAVGLSGGQSAPVPQGHVKEIPRAFNSIIFSVALLPRCGRKCFNWGKSTQIWQTWKSKTQGTPWPCHPMGTPSRCCVMLFSLLVKALKLRAPTRLFCAPRVTSEAT